MGQNGMKKHFRGSYIAKIDDRGRVKIPAQYLSALEQGFGKEVYLTSINGDHILFYPMQIWEEIERKIARIPMRDPDLEEYISRISFGAVKLKLTPKAAS
jgi:MraZ protein